MPRAARATEASFLLVPARPVSWVAAASLLRGNFSVFRFVDPVPARVGWALLFRRFELELFSSTVLLAATREDNSRVVRIEGSAGRLVPTYPRCVLPLPSGTEFIFRGRRDELLMYPQVKRSPILFFFVVLSWKTKPQHGARH